MRFLQLTDLRVSVDAAAVLVSVVTLGTSTPCCLALWLCRGREMRGFMLFCCSPSLESGARLCSDKLPSTDLNLNLNLKSEV